MKSFMSAFNEMTATMREMENAKKPEVADVIGQLYV